MDDTLRRIISSFLIFKGASVAPAIRERRWTSITLNSAGSPSAINFAVTICSPILSGLPRGLFGFSPSGSRQRRVSDTAGAEQGIQFSVGAFVILGFPVFGLFRTSQ